MRRHSILSVTLLSLMFTSQANAEALFLNGLSPRSIGRGGTNIAHSDNGAIIYDNPAAMINIEGKWLKEFAVDVIITDFEYQDAENPRTGSSTTGTPLPQFSIIRKSEDGHWAYGFGVFTPAGFSTSYSMNGTFPFLGEQSYDSFGSLTKVLPSLAYAPNDRFSIGGTLGVGISHVEFETPYFLQSPGLQGTPILLDLQGTGATLVWSLGMQYQVSNETTVGLTYQSKSSFKLDGPTNIAIPTVGSSRYDSDLKITWPQSLGFGVKHRVSDRGTFSADVIWSDWSSAFNNIEVALNGPTTPGFPVVVETIPLNWDDTISVRLGHEIDLGCSRTIRFGYAYNNNPIPNSTITPLIPAITEHALSAGYGFEVFNVEIDLAYMLTIGKDMRTTTNQFIGGDFNNARTGAVTHAGAIGVIKRF